ncbi:MAG: segregation/condensation protein A, partial [Nanoarchaeota archaeon]
MGDEEDYNFDVVKEVRKDGEKSVNRVGQEEIQGLLFGEQLSWQAIIYDLINTDQLDPWDIDLVLLTSKYLEKIRAFEEANLFVSSKVLFAAALLLRIKSEILLNKYIPSLDIILFGQKEEKKYKQERIELDEEIPELIPKTPLARFKKVTLEELMSALGKAVATENRRIDKVVLQRQQEMEPSISLPKMRINIKA